jgi:RNA polymerase sigma-70 factor (ECF subfamily)
MDSEAATEQVIRSEAPEEAALLRRLRAGDEAAFSELWERFGPRLVGYAASRLGGDEGLAEDATAQSLAAAVGSIRSFDPRRSSLSAWVYGVARRVIHGELRKQRRRGSVPVSAEVPLNEEADLLAAADPAPDLASRLEAQRKVLALAATLSQTEMEVLVLHFVDEFSVKEIAQITGRSWRAADSLLYRAKEKARERLMQDGD